MFSGSKEDDDAEDDDEDNYPLEDYENPATIATDTELIGGASLPVFLAEPLDSYVVKGKPATLQCRAAHALQVRLTLVKSFEEIFPVTSSAKTFQVFYHWLEEQFYLYK